METDSPTDGLPRRTYVTAGEAAEFLSLHVRTVYSYAQTGRLTPYYITGSRAVRFRREDVLALLGKSENTGRDRQEEGKG